MMISEFKTLTGFHPPMSLYEVIERDYESSNLDKYEYCEAYKTDKDGMAERLARIVDKLAWEQTDRATKELSLLQHNDNYIKRIEILEKWLAEVRDA